MSVLAASLRDITAVPGGLDGDGDPRVGREALGTLVLLAESLRDVTRSLARGDVKLTPADAWDDVEHGTNGDHSNDGQTADGPPP